MDNKSGLWLVKDDFAKALVFATSQKEAIDKFAKYLLKYYNIDSVNKECILIQFLGDKVPSLLDPVKLIRLGKGE